MHPIPGPPDSLDLRPLESQMERDQREANEKLVLAALRAQEEAELARHAQGSAEVRERSHRRQIRRLGVELAQSEENERKRIAAEIHDDLGQTLAAVRLRLDALRSGVDEGARVEIRGCIALLEDCGAKARALTFDLMGPAVHEKGLVAAIRVLAAEMGRRHHVHVVVTASGEPTLPDETTRAVLYRAVREVLTNVVKHASTDAARVVVVESAQRLRIDVTDGGVGFDPEELLPTRTGGFGLFSIREQMVELGGRMDVSSVRGKSTRVRLVLPRRG